MKHALTIFVCFGFRRRYPERGHEGMRELRGQRDAPVAEGRHGSPSVQRVRLVQQDQRSESAAGQVCAEENHPGTMRHDKPIMTARIL